MGTPWPFVLGLLPVDLAPILLALRASCRRWPADSRDIRDRSVIAVVVLDLALGLDVVLGLAICLERTSAAFFSHKKKHRKKCSQL
jgi:hypothetical protein